jgi:hypothetical protein
MHSYLPQLCSPFKDALSCRMELLNLGEHLQVEL